MKAKVLIRHVFCLHTQSRVQQMWKRMRGVARQAVEVRDANSLTAVSIDAVSGMYLRNGSAVTSAEWLPVKRKTDNYFSLYIVLFH